MHYKKLYINGKWVEPNSTSIIEVENPANKTIIGSVPAANEDDINMAVKAAREAFVPWSTRPLEDRVSFVQKLFDMLINIKEELADIVVMELGSSRSFALNTHIMPYLLNIEDYIKIVENYEFEERYPGYIVTKEPVGVVAALTPWNYPFGQIIKKLIPALLAGNTMVLKPSQKTPLIAVKLTEAIDKVAFPEGVFNLVTGKGSEVGNILATHKDVDMVTLTGSTSAGIEVGKLAMDDLKRLTLELGGKSPGIILKGADYDLALTKVLDKVFLNTGQTCSALSRLIIPREEKEIIEELIIEKSKKYKVGNPNEADTIVGPLASKKQFDKVSYYINKGIEEGASLLVGEVPKESEGYYVSPTVFVDVNNNMEIARNEIFGPVLSVICYDSVEEAISIANDTQFGLSGAVFGPNESAKMVAKQIRTGNIVVNEGNFTHKAPFGGFKHSGIGREGGKYGIEEFLEIKATFY